MQIYQRIPPGRNTTFDGLFGGMQDLPQMNYCKFRLALDIFSELGLVQQDLWTRQVHRKPVSAKVDLQQSVLLQGLRKSGCCMTQENTNGDTRSAAPSAGTDHQIPQHEVSIADLSKKILATDKQYDLKVKFSRQYQLAEKAHADQSGLPENHISFTRWLLQIFCWIWAWIPILFVCGTAARCGRGYELYAGRYSQEIRAGRGNAGGTV